MLKKLFLASVLASAVGSAGHAATIVSAVGVTATSERSGVSAAYTIDQSGLSVGYTSGITDFDAYIASNPIHTYVALGNEWFSDFGNTTPTLTFDLGSVLNIDRVALWVEESSGFSTADVTTSTDGVTFTSLTTISPQDNPLADYPAEVFSFTTTALRYFRMDLSGCPQPNPGSTDECSLGEIAFSAVDTPPVPVPAAGFLFVSGLGALAAMRRRKTR
ncbi:hypothetical protein RGUI_2435 [Rhodovulum sp. P5]|uniref:VPLPA-CTERM sorting domain-containing protein n=1 Tax=Rhodovulum sp. P5 TaxID=1564506 RepID=UPI0009C3B143|nr:VPLPA-CTERM sorting domain-containing protein [Rhodovulum sp. P5]ARE40576.1 hypothetical protein RGUI_2435 [Rhodovulum sp. P5]